VEDAGKEDMDAFKKALGGSEIDTKEYEALDDDKTDVFVDSKETHTGAANSHTFQTETRQILNIVANSLYTDKEVFLRELISNASDALEKACYATSTNQQLVDPDRPLEIRIEAHENKNTITIMDSGIGMTDKELIENLGTIARSGSKQWLQQLKDSEGDVASNANIIGQFGVGFYSTFMVADKVEVYSQPAMGGPAHYWVSDGSGSFSLSEAQGVSRGTKIILHLKDDCKRFAAKHQILGIVKRYSNFVGFPIYINGKLQNTVQAIWLKDPKSVTDAEHEEFYKYISNAFDAPYYRLHFHSEVPLNINALFYVPTSHMEKFGMGRMEPGVSVYSRKVLIKAKSKDILPDWMRFVKGVVDSEDIPLNISRENMQDTQLLTRISNVLSKKVIRFLDDCAISDPEKYDKFFLEFGPFIKEGACTDFRNKDEIAKLLRFETSMEEGKRVSLDEYISRMSPEQKGIYYFSAQSRHNALSSPYYEQFKGQKTEVLFLYSNLDTFVMTNLATYNKRKLISIETAEVEKSTEEEKKTEAEGIDEAEFLKWAKLTLADKVSSVKATTRLLSSPAIVVDHESGSVRRMMKYVDQSLPGTMRPLSKQKLEVNMSHPIIKRLAKAKDSQPEEASAVLEQVFDNALIAADIMDNPHAMLSRLNKILEFSLHK